MPVEIKGQQLRIRVKSPKNFSKFRTDDVGSRGRLQRVAGMTSRGRWSTQSWRLNLGDYNDDNDARDEVWGLYEKGRITRTQLDEARRKITMWFHRSR